MTEEGLGRTGKGVAARSSSRFRSSPIFRLLGSHCEPRFFVCEAISSSAVLRLLRRYAPRSDKTKKLLASDPLFVTARSSYRLRSSLLSYPVGIRDCFSVLATAKNTAGLPRELCPLVLPASCKAPAVARETASAILPSNRTLPQGG